MKSDHNDQCDSQNVEMTVRVLAQNDQKSRFFLHLWSNLARMVLEMLQSGGGPKVRILSFQGGLSGKVIIDFGSKNQQRCDVIFFSASKPILKKVPVHGILPQ